MTANAPERRAADHPVYTRVLRFLLAPLVDNYQGLSLTRVLALGGFVVICFVIIVTRLVTWTDFWGLVACLSAAFGKGIWTRFLDKVRLGVSGAQVQTDTRITETKTETIRADLHYTADGVPAFSNPPVAGARTPSGDD